MEQIDLFRLLVEYHYERNLPACLPFIKNGISSLPLTEGKGENDKYNGVLIVSNGDTLPEELVRRGVISNLDDISDPVDIRSREELFGYMDEQSGLDGVYLFNGPRQSIRWVYKLNYPRLQEDVPFESLLPEDFFCYDGSRHHKNIRANIGTRLRLAIELSQAYPNFESYQIKETPYTSLKIGKVVHVTSRGLDKEFFFKHDPDIFGDCIDIDRSIVGVRRSYMRVNGELLRISERNISSQLLSLSEQYSCS